MSRENLVKLMQATSEDEQLKVQVQNARSYEELRKVAQEQGFDMGDLSAEQAQRTIDVVTGQVTEELSEEELELVAGGAAGTTKLWDWMKKTWTMNDLPQV